MCVLELIGFVKEKKRPTGDFCDRKDVEHKETSTQKEDWADQHRPTMKTEDVLEFALSVTVSQVSSGKMAVFGSFFSSRMEFGFTTLNRLPPFLSM